MKNLSFLFLSFLVSIYSFAQQPLQSKGQSASTWERTLKLQAPHNQITKITDSNILVETGNENIVNDPGFERPLGSVGANGFTSNGTLGCVNGNTNIGLDPLFGANSLQLTINSATSGHCTSPAYAIPNGLFNKNGLLYFRTKGAGSVRDITIDVLTSGGSVLATHTFKSNSDGWVKVPFIFPDSSVSTTVSWKISVASASLVYFQAIDDVYIGKNTDIGTVQQATIYGTATWAATAGCEWTTGDTSGVFTEFGVDSDCPNPTVTGQASAPSTKVPRIKFASLPAGKYEVVQQCRMLAQNGSTSATLLFKLSDGTTTDGSATISVVASQANSYVNTMVGLFEYTTSQSNIEFRPVAFSSSNSNDPYLNAIADECTITVKRFPSTAEEVLSLNTLPSKTNPLCVTPSWTNIGFSSFNNNSLCWYKDGPFMFIDFFAYPSGGSGSASALSLAIPGGYTIDTSSNKFVCGTQGRCSVGWFDFYNDSGGAAGDGGYVTYNSTTAVGFRRGNSSTFTTSSMTTSDAISGGFKVPIVGWNAPAVEMPLVKQSVVTDNANPDRVVRFSMSATCSINGSCAGSGSGMTMSRTGTGAYDADFVPDFSVSPTCTCSSTGSSTQACQFTTRAATGGSFVTSITTTGATQDGKLDVICFGQR